MQIDIGRYIDYLLQKSGYVALKGIGTVSIHRQEAFFAPSKEKLEPPKASIVFTESTDNFSQLIQLIEKNERITREVAQDVVDKYTESLLNQLLNYKIVKLSSIGFLELKDGKKEFIPSESALLNLKSKLHSIPITPVERLARYEHKKAMVDDTSSTELSLWKGEWINYLCGFLLGGLLVWAYHQFIEPSIQSGPQVVEYISAEQDTTKDETKYEDSSADINQSSEISDSISEEVPFDSAAIKIAEPDARTECIIIVGAFSKTIYAMEMLDRIRNAGYTPYDDNYNDVKRVGIRYLCEEKDLEDFIKEVRRKFGARAWSLVPRVSI